MALCQNWFHDHAKRTKGPKTSYRGMCSLKHNERRFQKCRVETICFRNDDLWIFVKTIVKKSRAENSESCEHKECSLILNFF